MAVPHRAPAQAVAPAALGLVLTGVTSVQFGAAIAAGLFDDLGPAGVSLLRLGLAAVILVAVWRPRPRGRERADVRLVVLFGLALGFMNLTFYEALDRIPLGIAVTLEFVGPLGVAIAGSRRLLDAVWAVLAALGIVMLADPFRGGSLDGLGVMLALVAGGFWALYIVLAAKAGPRFKGSEGVTFAMVVGTIVPLVPGIAEAGGKLLDPRLLGIGAAVALLSSVIPYSVETEALRRIPQHVFGVLMSIEPGVAALAGFVVLGQSLAARQIVAIGLVVAASVGASGVAPRPAEA